MDFAYANLQCFMFGLLKKQQCPYAQNSTDKKYLILASFVLGTFYVSTVFVNYEEPVWYMKGLIGQKRWLPCPGYIIY